MNALNFNTASQVIKQFYMLAFDYKNTVDPDNTIIPPPMWKSMMATMDEMLAKHLYVIDESSDTGSMYKYCGLFSSIDNEPLFEQEFIDTDDIYHSVLGVDKNSKFDKFKDFVRFKLVSDTDSDMIKEFIYSVYDYINTVFTDTVTKNYLCANLIMIEDLMLHFDTIVVNSYLLMNGDAGIDVDTQVTSMARSVTINTMCHLLCKCVTVDLPPEVKECIPDEYKDSTDTGYVSISSFCWYDKNEFEYNGTDIFKNALIPSKLSIAVQVV